MKNGGRNCEGELNSKRERRGLGTQGNLFFDDFNQFPVAKTEIEKVAKDSQ